LLYCINPFWNIWNDFLALTNTALGPAINLLFVLHHLWDAKHVRSETYFRFSTGIIAESNNGIDHSVV